MGSVKNGDTPAYPHKRVVTPEYDPNAECKPYEVFTSGLTKRELISAMVLQGLCANSIRGPHHEPQNIIPEAIYLTDKLLDALEN